MLTVKSILKGVWGSMWIRAIREAGRTLVGVVCGMVAINWMGMAWFQLRDDSLVGYPVPAFASIILLWAICYGCLSKREVK